MKRLLSLLERLPHWLPFATRQRHFLPVESFSRRDILIYTGLLLTWFGAGVILLVRHNTVLGGLYCITGLAAYVVYVYLICTRCPYYNKDCYMLGGQCAGRWFDYRPGDYTRFEDFVVPLLWIGVSAYPAIFLAWYRAWASLVLYLALTLAWQILHKRNVCVKCRNIRCALNPRYEGRARCA